MTQTKEVFDGSTEEDLVLEHLGYQQGTAHIEIPVEMGLFGGKD